MNADRHDQLRAAYAAGALDPALALMLETQAALSPRAARDLALADELSGVFLEQQAPTPLAPEALERTFARITAVPAQSPAAPQRTREPLYADDLRAFPEGLRTLALEAAAARGWKFAGRGIRSLVIDTGGEAMAEILRIAPGAAAPEHTHSGEEYTLVLTGAFHDDAGLYRPGDIAIADPRITHRPTAEPGAVCYSFAVTDGPLKFTGAMGLLTKLWRN